MLNRQHLMPWLNWGMATTYVFFQFFLQATAGLMASKWSLDFQLTKTQVGSLSAAFFLAYVIMQIPVGLAYDRFGTRKILISASILLSLGIFGLGLSQSYGQAYLARLIMGSGSAFGFIGMLYVTASWFSNRHFTMLVGISETLAMMGVALGEVGMASLITHLGWRVTMYVVGCCAIVVTLFVIFIIQDPEHCSISEEREQISPSKALKQVLQNPQVWLAGLYGFAMISIINAIANLWGIPFLVHRYPAMSLYTVSTLMSVVFIGAAIGGPFCAWLVQCGVKRQIVMTLFASLTFLFYSFVVYLKIEFLGILYFLLFLTGFFSSAYILVFGVVKDSVTNELRGTALSTSNMILMMSALILQPLLGKSLELHFNFEQTLSIITAALVIATLLSLALDKKHIMKDEINPNSMP
ncbi:MFS transporter [Legionella parisiensis]|uniref:Lysosomal dipeptide transporter MFSD1 n=1 Tax=Legionella parisiensis TaxID=45071 RepID=A0A1E5JU41_9GAMM|nr:MFS transporter [Legionella parisiensis]KTD41811.1 major facilitator superfamily (MFS) transporter [Legionella parisiensis]OEH48046.1 putative galactarate transporter [Legionella parisiensis]STX75863.1 major facilitator superfamily (MFS) transporter [Legionella parisiensis]